jgi:hypothetical protein
MKARTYLAAAGAATLLAAGAFVLPAAASTPRPSEAGSWHTLKFVSVTVRQLTFTKTNTAQQDTDVSYQGRIIGFDQLNLTYDPKTGTGTGTFTFDYDGGFLYGTLNLASAGATGTLTGGTGKFAGAAGTLTAVPLDKSGFRTAVTLKYRA